MKRIIIIAEAGVNHNGSLSLAKKLADVAKDSGADVVKFQSFKTDRLVSRHADLADYQKKNTGMSTKQKEMLGSLSLSEPDFRELAEYCKKIGIEFLSTPFDIESVHFLNEIQEEWKIPSGEITNYPYLVEIAMTGKPVIMSTGMAELQEVDEAVKVLEKFGAGEISLLHCTTEYPTPFEEVNLRAMLTLKEVFGLKTGYSDHTKGIEIPIAAVAMGAEIIEKHFTLDRNMEGPDHKASLEPDELYKMVRSIRNVEKAMGDCEKKPSKSETKNIPIVRKSIVADRNIKKGDMFTTDNITTKRPGTGISPMKWREVIGTRAIRDFEEDELIEI